MSRMEGLTVAVSVSDAPDRARLGLPAREVDRAVLTICTALVREGADILYAGNLAPDQYTFKIFRHLAGAYAGARESAPFLHLVPEPVVRRSAFDLLLAGLNESGAVARTRISIGGGLVSIRASGSILLVGDAHQDRMRIANPAEWDAWLAGYPVSGAADAHSAARRAMATEADARVSLGGKMGVLSLAEDRYEGVMPGVAEEAILTLEASRPLIPLGAFGGAARDIAIALGLLEKDRRVPRGEQQPGYAESMDRVAELADRIPDVIKAELGDLANDDRSEATSFAVVNAILDWRAVRPGV